MTQSIASRYFRPLVAFLFAVVCVPLALGNGPDVIKASHKDVSPPLAQMAISLGG